MTSDAEPLGSITSSSRNPVTRSPGHPVTWSRVWLPAALALVVLVAVGLVTRLPLPVALAAGLAAVGVAVAAVWPFAGLLVRQIVENPMLNGTVIRLDGALRMP